jgi:hypothetical protein
VDIVKRPLQRFDFTPPGGKRHPGERFVDVLGLVNAGLISEADIGRQRAFTDEELREKMEALASLGIDVKGNAFPRALGVFHSAQPTFRTVNPEFGEVSA